MQQQQQREEQDKLDRQRLEKIRLENERKEKERLANIEQNTNSGNAPEAVNPQSAGNNSPVGMPPGMPGNLNPPTVNNDVASAFYFYNPSTVAYGKLQFKKMWGNRALAGNWRLSASRANENTVLTDSISMKQDSINALKDLIVIEKYTTDFYEKQLPITQIAMDSIGKERNFAYYQLGLIYKEKFKEYDLASGKFEQLLRNNPEEKWILQAFKQVFKESDEKLPRLMLVPRHPERFEEVENQIKETGFEFVRRSQSVSKRDISAEIILLDSIGELRSVYPLAELVFVGGSLIAHGGQSILEPAIAEKAIVTGFYTMNFKAIVKEFSEKNALVQLPELDDKDIAENLSATFLQLLKDLEKRKNLGKNALAVMEKNRGATEKTLEYLAPILQSTEKK